MDEKMMSEKMKDRAVKSEALAKAIRPYLVHQFKAGEPATPLMMALDRCEQLGASDELPIAVTVALLRVLEVLGSMQVDLEKAARAFFGDAIAEEIDKPISVVILAPNAIASDEVTP